MHHSVTSRQPSSTKPYYLNFHDWDICAGEILVTEAGGRVTLFDGSPVTYGGKGAVQRRGMIATNGVLHATVLERLLGI